MKNANNAYREAATTTSQNVSNFTHHSENYLISHSLFAFEIYSCLNKLFLFWILYILQKRSAKRAKRPYKNLPLSTKDRPVYVWIRTIQKKCKWYLQILLSERQKGCRTLLPWPILWTTKKKKDLHTKRSRNRVVTCEMWVTFCCILM